jgi:hypothetical protein
MPCPDMKLRSSVSIPGGKRAAGSSKQTLDVPHLHYPLVQGLLLVLFISLVILVLRLLYSILLLVGPQYQAILCRCSVVILRGTFSAHPVER